MEELLYGEPDEAMRSPVLDNLCKRVLADKYILAWILKSCTDEFKDCEIRDIAEKYIEGQPEIGSVGVLPDQTNRRINGISNEEPSVSEGSVRYDIRFCALAPSGNELIKLIVNIEAQSKYNNSYPLTKRAIYYLSRMISAQYGTEFDHSHYEGIKKVYSIWICTNPPKKRQSTIVKYSIVEENIFGEASEKPENYDLMTAVILCLDDDINSDNSILRLLSVLMSRELNAASKVQILSDGFDIPMSNDFESEVYQMCNVSVGIYEHGMKTGFERGIERGIGKGLFKALDSMLSTTDFTFEQAAAMIGIPESEWNDYRRLLNEKNG